MTCWSEKTAKQPLKDFHNLIYEAVEEQDVEKRKGLMRDLVKHPGFRPAHPREEHFVPIYVAAGAGETGKVKIINALYSAPTFAFGV
jgi:aromatic ring-opening dioxygenase catalytic subunit (LigB family)